MASLVYSKSGSNLLSLAYSYSQSGNNNGQTAGITDNVQSGRTVTYTYDVLHHLKTAVTNGSVAYPQWGLSWVYDRWGNRTQQNVTAGTPPSNVVTVNTSTNRITNMGAFTFTYDANGNLTQDDLYKYKYDAENRMVELRLVNDALVATYAYDGNSLRVIKVVGADRTWYLYSGTSVVSEFEDAASSSYSSGTTPGQTNGSGETQLYQHSDHLTTRLTTENSGGLSNWQGHYPYGDAWYVDGDADPSVMKKFTSYEKDTEASAGQIHYAIAREQLARLGRFNTSDPREGAISNPQSLNRYSYVGGNPISRVDPRGLGWCTLDGMYTPDEICDRVPVDAVYVRQPRGLGGGGGTPVASGSNFGALATSGIGVNTPVTIGGLTISVGGVNISIGSGGVNVGVGGPAGGDGRMGGGFGLPGLGLPQVDVPGSLCFCSIVGFFTPCILGCPYVCVCGESPNGGIGLVFSSPMLEFGFCPAAAVFWCPLGAGLCRPVNPPQDRFCQRWPFN